MRNPGAGIGRDIGQGERAEAELDSFISRRDRQRRETEGDRAAEDLWEASSRLHSARRRAENRAAWCEYHRGRADSLRRTLGALVAHHEAEAERLMGEGAA